MDTFVARRRLSHVAILVLTTFVANSTIASAAPQITPEDVLKVKSVDYLSVSPNGRRLLVRTTQADLGMNDYKVQWLVVQLGSQELPFPVPAPWNEVLSHTQKWWDRDSRRIQFLETIKGNTYLAALDLDTFTKTSVCDESLGGGDISILGLNSAVSPNGQYLVYLRAHSETDTGVDNHEPLTGINADVNWTRVSRMPNPELDRKNALDISGESPYTLKPTELWLLDIKGKTRRQLLNDDGEITSYLWMGNEDVWYLRRDKAASLGLLSSININSGSQNNHGGFPNAWEMSGSSTSHRICVTIGNDRLTFVDALSGKSTAVVDLSAFSETADFGLLSSPNVWSLDGKELLLSMAGHMRDSLFVFDIDHERVRQVAESDKQFTRLGGDPSADVVAVVREDLGDPQDICLVDRRNWSTREGFDPNESIRSLPWPSTTEVRWLSGDKRFVVHGLLLGPTRKGDRPRPLLLVNNGGPGLVDRAFDGSAGYPLAVFASSGYLVLNINSRGRPGYGHGFGMAIRDERSRFEAPLEYDIIPGIDLLVRRRVADPRRLGMMGESYGGALTAWAVCRSNRFKAVSIAEGTPLDEISDMFELMGSKEEIAHFTGQLGFRIPFLGKERKLIEKENPYDHVEDVRTPSLYEGGILAAAPTFGRGWYHAMQFFNVPSELVVYPRSGHGWSEPLLILDSYRRNVAWFDYWIRGEPYPDSRRQQEYDAWKEKRADAGDPRWVQSSHTTLRSGIQLVR